MPRLSDNIHADILTALQEGMSVIASASLPDIDAPQIQSTSDIPERSLEYMAQIFPRMRPAKNANLLKKLVGWGCEFDCRVFKEKINMQPELLKLITEALYIAIKEDNVNALKYLFVEKLSILTRSLEEGDFPNFDIHSFMLSPPDDSTPLPTPFLTEAFYNKKLYCFMFLLGCSLSEPTSELSPALEDFIEAIPRLKEERTSPIQGVMIHYFRNFISYVAPHHPKVMECLEKLNSQPARSAPTVPGATSFSLTSNSSTVSAQTVAALEETAKPKPRSNSDDSCRIL